MTDFVPQPCARWADLLAAHPDDLSAQERRALDAHVASCRACAAIRADDQRMAGQIRSMPDPRIRPDFPSWLLALQEAAKRDASAQSQIIPFHSTEKHMQTQKEPGRVIPAPTPINQGQHSRRRVVSWVTAVAALVVVALITAALLASHAGKPPSTGSPGNTTPTPTPASSRAWTSPSGLADLADQPVIAPSNPKIIYLVGNYPLTLKKSEDGGAHWVNVPLPAQASSAESRSFTINPGNAQNVFLEVSFELSSPACAGGQASTGTLHAYSGASCGVPYYSTDGGAHWGLMRCQGCAQTVFASGGLAPAGYIVAQGNRLYSSYYDTNGGEHLMASADHGANWTPADAALLAQGQGACSFAVLPTVPIVFALAQSGYCSQPLGYGSQPVGALLNAATRPQAGSNFSIWRSDDAGAHWTRVSAFPYQQPDTAVFSAYDTGGVHPTLYAAAGQGSAYQRLLSTDGGKTWHALPMAGIPADVTIFSLAQPTLSDGSLLMEAQVAPNAPTKLYALKPGSQVWHQVAQPFTGGFMALIVSPASNGPDTLWLVTVSSKSDFSVSYYTL